MPTTSDFKTGMMIEVDGELYRIADYQHVKPGKGGALYKTKLKSLKSGNIIDKTFRAGEKIKKPFVEVRKLNYMYNAGELYYFMDESTYEEVVLGFDAVGEKGRFLSPNAQVSSIMIEGGIVDIELPASVGLEVEKTEPGVRGDTVSGASKPAVLETGLTVQVPLFINEGDVVKIDTRTGEYLGRES